jgi:hypothetical protein
MIRKEGIVLALLALAALGAYYGLPVEAVAPEEPVGLDMECGFTQDFADFLAKSILWPT